MVKQKSSHFCLWLRADPTSLQPHKQMLFSCVSVTHVASRAHETWHYLLKKLKMLYWKMWQKVAEGDSFFTFFSVL
jgi:hypothetical protein